MNDTIWIPFSWRMPQRGDRVRTSGGSYGIFVGRTPAGDDWVCYRAEKFETMCARFDERFTQTDRKVAS